MPLMMEEDMDMEELFGDGVGLSLPSRPPPKELYQRVDELRGSGCCQAIAWSKWGSIASITPDGTALELRNLRSHPNDGTWALGEPTPTPAFTHILDGGPLKHLAWSPTGSELAVADSAGRITILGLFSTLNKPTLHRSCQIDPADDLHRLVGSHWLNLAPYPPNRPKISHGPAVKDGNSYRYEASQAPVLGPCHPSHTKSAFVCVTTNGLLRVLYPQPNGKWYECHTELESIVSSDDLITHATICPDKNGTLLIAFATTSKQLRTVRAHIDWGQQKTNEKVPPGAIALNPTVKTRHTAVTSWLHDAPGQNLSSSQLDSSMAQLSQLEFLSPCGDAQGRMTPPTILAVRSHLPVSTSHYNQDVHTIVDRWELREKPQTIHPAFEQLSNRRNSVGQQPGTLHILKKAESISVNKILVAIQPMNLGKVIFFAYSDGSVEYRDRTTLLETYNDNDLNRVWHLSQIGFSYGEDDPCLQVALSPSYASVVQIGNDRKIRWKHLVYHMGDIGNSMEDAQYAGVVAALAVSCSSAVLRVVNYDDILATAHKHNKGNLSYDWLTELSRILKVTVDYSEEAHFDVLIRNTSIQLSLSIQNSLGFRGEFNPRTFGGKLAWLVLQLRNIVVLVTMAANVNIPQGPHNEKTSPLEDPEVISSLAGSVRWVLDLMAWLVETLLSFKSALPPGIDLNNPAKFNLPDLLSLLQKTNTISLHILLSSPTRGFLTAICRRLLHLDYIARKAMHTSVSSTSTSNTPNPQNPNQPPTPQPASTLSPALRAAYMQIATLTSAAILSTKTIENLLLSLTALVKIAYATSHPQQTPNSSSAMRNAQEIKMVFGGPFPEAFKTVIVELFRDGGLLAGVREEIDPAKLFFADFEMLEVDEDATLVRARKSKGRTMDCFRKAWLANPQKNSKGKPASASPEVNSNVVLGAIGGGRWRRCARCAAVMEDVLTQKQTLQWLVMQQRRCFCSGYWVTLAPGETVP